MTLFISDKKGNKSMGNLGKSAIFQFFFGLFCALFGAIYEIFSHEVFSFYMIYAFGIPLVLGTLIPGIMYLNGKKDVAKLPLKAWNYGIITLTVGCIFKGVLEIYGTTNRLIVVYPIAAAILMALALIGFILSKNPSENNKWSEVCNAGL